MHLTPKDEDRLLLFLAAELARKHRAAGLALSYAEARALIADEVVEAARAGATVAEAAAHGAGVLTDDDVMPGVPTCWARFRWRRSSQTARSWSRCTTPSDLATAPERTRRHPRRDPAARAIWNSTPAVRPPR